MAGPTTSAPPKTHRQARALRNDARILDAAVTIAADEGWAALVPSRVSAASGLVRSTVQERFRDRTALGSALWRERCGGALESALSQFLDSCGVGDTPAHASRIDQELRRLSALSPVLQGAAELLVAAHYDATLRREVTDSFGERVRQWCSEGDPTSNARTAYLLATGLGLILAARRSGAQELQWTTVAAAFEAGLTRTIAPAELPPITVPHFTDDLDLASDDPSLNALLNATLREIGARGFEGASVDQIARASHHTKGLVFSRFPSKLELFLEATRRQQIAAFAANDAFIQQVAAERGRGIAEAVAIREMQGPSIANGRSILMEQLRLSWHHREAKAAQEADLDAIVETLAQSHPDHFAHEATVMHVGYAVGLGVAMLPLLCPDAYLLPYDVMTVPLVELGL